MQVVLLLLLSYLIGSIPFSYLVAKIATGVDIRYAGEGNVGARNVWHVAGPIYGLIAGALDMLKGLSVFFLASRWAGSEVVFYSAGGAVILGHGFPLFLKGRGGKGISTALGFLLELVPQALVVGALLFAIAWLVTRNFNISAGIGLGSIPFSAPLFGKPPSITVWIIALFLLLAFKKVWDRPHESRIREQSGWFEPKGIVQR
ncbi:MAG: glycerol-3-phosphate acyltransferase [Chloroflexi bacterium]|nr:MAG: glycerol-3-phosphate acyltransferase [Chloroflexota bacterium]HDN79383.1 glycerol-3-phosphate acyltransferase [Chloroflexota bacterium]